MSTADAMARATRASFCMMTCSLVAIEIRCWTPPAFATAPTTSCLVGKQKRWMGEINSNSLGVGKCAWLLTGLRLCLMRAASRRLASPFTPPCSLVSHQSMIWVSSTVSLPSTSAASSVSDTDRRSALAQQAGTTGCFNLGHFIQLNVHQINHWNQVDDMQVQSYTQFNTVTFPGLLICLKNTQKETWRKSLHPNWNLFLDCLYITTGIYVFLHYNLPSANPDWKCIHLWNKLIKFL